VPPAVGGVTRPEDETVRLECVEEADKVARVYPQRGAELLLRQRPHLVQVVEHRELMVSHVEGGERLGEAVARRPSKPQN
jgi:hypothetical protein